MRSTQLLVAAALACAVALVGCDKSRPVPPVADSAGCLGCHGGEENSTGAPPWSVARLDHTAATVRVEVGAHTRHIARGVSCGACHVVPTRVISPGHLTGGRATVVFKEVASTGNAIPSTWAPAVHTCSNYCHGSTINHGGTNHTPDWLVPAQGACGTCHFTANVAPPAQHPKGPGANGAFADTRTCAVCHPDTVDAVTGDINVAGGKHVNGQLDGGGGHSPGWADPANHGRAANAGLAACKTCHGADFAGGTSTVSCNACHAAVGHPNWQSECTFCHGLPTRTADATFPLVPAVLPAGANASLQVRANLASPPLGTQGENVITAYAVGAHDAHTTVGPFGRASQCFDCHGPALPGDTTHVDGQVVLGWSTVASNGIVPTPVAGANYPRWNDTTGVVPNCTNFCHGATLAGGTHTSPKWNEGPAGASCGSCHAVPLPYTLAGGWHVQRTDCNTCHPGYTSTSVNVADHIFVGAGPSNLTCHSCHGTISNNAPPNDILGATTGNGVGAHQKHVATLTLRSTGLPCTECHTDNTGNNLHANGVVNISWGPIASYNSAYAVTPATGTFTPGVAFPTCTNWCHQPRPLDTAAGLVTTVSWNPPSTIVCGSCHGLPPLTASHPTGASACSSCHDGYANAPTAASTFTAVSLANHINGVIDVRPMSCTSCHGTAGRVGVAGADPLVAVAPPIAMTNTLAVGAHLAHVNQGDTAAPGALSNPFPCTTCHTGLIYTNAPHGTPANPVAFGNLALAASAVPSPYNTATRSCASTYCHGNFSGGNGANAIGWDTAGKLACTACHGTPPTIAAHPANSNCGNCHPGYTISTVNVATHVNGQVDGGESTGATPCLNCHKTDATTGAKYNMMVSDTTVYHHVVAEGTTFKPYPTTTGGQACLQCHADHDIFGSGNASNTLGRGANLRTAIGALPTTTANYANTDFSGTAGICLSCHSVAGGLAKSTTAQKSYAGAGNTLTDVVDGTLYSASAHQYVVAGTITTGASLINANCMKCHSDQQTATYPERQSGTYRFALHTSVDRRLRNPMGQTAPVDDHAENYCFRCHSTTTDTLPGGGPVKGVANRDYFNAATMSSGAQDIFQAFTNTLHTSKHNVAGYDQIHQPTEAPAGAGGTKHVECEDCHEPHAAKAGSKAATNQNTVWGPLTGVTGVAPTWGATVWSNATAYTAVTATYEYQICFKCHSGANTGLATWGGTATYGTVANTPSWTDLALEFNPANKSRHPVAAPLNATGSGTTALVASQLINGWAPGNVMTCSDCHGAESASPAAQGPHGSAVKWMLHGTNRAWPYNVAGATSGTLIKLSTSETGLGTANGLFCRNCHPQQNNAASNAIHRLSDLNAGQHGGSATVPACASCHMRVPHGGKVSRLMITTNAPARYRVGTANLAGFTKQAKDAYTLPNSIKSSCGQHSSGTGTEAW